MSAQKNHLNEHSQYMLKFMDKKLITILSEKVCITGPVPYHSELLNSVGPDQLASDKPADLDLHCLGLPPCLKILRPSLKSSLFAVMRPTHSKCHLPPKFMVILENYSFYSNFSLFRYFFYILNVLSTNQ